MVIDSECNIFRFKIFGYSIFPFWVYLNLKTQVATDTESQANNNKY